MPIFFSIDRFLTPVNLENQKPVYSFSLLIVCLRKTKTASGMDRQGTNAKS